MDFNYEALVNMMILARIKENDPIGAKVFNVFLKRGISVTEAMAILLELLTLGKEIEKGEEAKDE